MAKGSMQALQGSAILSQIGQLAYPDPNSPGARLNQSMVTNAQNALQAEALQEAAEEAKKGSWFDKAVGVVSGAAQGFAVGGPVGAAAGGITGGVKAFSPEAGQALSALQSFGSLGQSMAGGGGGTEGIPGTREGDFDAAKNVPSDVPATPSALEGGPLRTAPLATPPAAGDGRLAGATPPVAASGFAKEETPLWKGQSTARNVFAGIGAAAGNSQVNFDPLTGMKYILGPDGNKMFVR